jgi:hypothetical protein
MAMQALLLEDRRDTGTKIDLSRQNDVKKNYTQHLLADYAPYENLVMPGCARGATAKLPCQSTVAGKICSCEFIA